MNETYYEAMEAYDKVFNSGHTDIDYCQKMACKDPAYAYWYAMEVKGADIDYCQKMACKDPYFAYCFARDVKMADLEVCLEAVSGTEWEGVLRELVVDTWIG